MEKSCPIHGSVNYDPRTGICLICANNSGNNKVCPTHGRATFLNGVCLVCANSTKTTKREVEYNSPIDEYLKQFMAGEQTDQRRYLDLDKYIKDQNKEEELEKEKGMSEVFCAIHGSSFMNSAVYCVLCAGADNTITLSNWGKAKTIQPVPDQKPLTVRLSVEGEEKYTYTFRVATVPGCTLSRSFCEIMDAFFPKVTLIFTEDEFKKFRLDLLKDGFDLRDIYRVPYHDGEKIL